MSLYNMMNGRNDIMVLALPMIGLHPRDIPRLRDYFKEDSEHPEYGAGHIHVYTRTGGGNREDYEEENGSMEANPNFVGDFDDSFDSTFASWVFKIPEKYLEDFNLLMGETPSKVSEEYKQFAAAFLGLTIEKES